MEDITVSAVRDAIGRVLQPSNHSDARPMQQQPITP
jgi:hypothetical protein